MNYPRIAIFAGAATAFLFMLATVTASSEFVYAPESTWKEDRDTGQDVAVAAWRSQQSTVTASSAMSRIPVPASSATSSAPDEASSAATDAASSIPVSSAPADGASSSENPDFPDWAREWWERFGDDGDDDDGDRKGRKGKRD